ncbi:Ig-like domain-containing protein [Velocimicrobium porci]|uniref:BIG2 domain-containing protein n=1 Tax=Velocimicrobium porci TaxID=2606634 RepID=A0A6L5XVF9_9FIRM|nr:Ig-like domain-containing protein [Velocimicrobium porci]MSS62732.1 hypothetical protein [Velocimicrobium porci]
MKNVLKKAISGILALSMAAAMMVSTAIPAQAATKKVIPVKVSYNGKNWENDSKLWAHSQSDCVITPGDKTYKLTNTLSINYQVYIPKTVLQKNGSAIDLNTSLNVMDSTKDWNWLGSIEGKYSISVVNEKGKYGIYAWNNETEKMVSAKDTAKLVTLKKDGDYVIATVKNVALKSEMETGDGKSKKIDTKTPRHLNATVRLCGVNTKVKATLYIDNVVVTSGQKKIFSINCSDKNMLYFYYMNGSSKEKVVQPVTYSNTLLKLTKTSATIKTGKTVSINAKATPAEKITYKSSNEKVAKVSSKGIVTGVNAGKAAITVTTNGVSKNFSVTVTK